ncbi:hypothetical protein [Ferrovibrio sp.]|uniref:hypothetical protein n=1 Tax=Ferrovibrio sp. TaxID=1917215 RepID=UPI000CBC03CE|nr:hypothetical protein [Ferrovibrio sp.]PJI37915.1 MAG: hypothetical protein CTR53_18105 [Ferrovibrio sp.]
MRLLHSIFLAGVTLAALPAWAGDETDVRWEPLRAPEQRVRWEAEGLTAAPQLAESFSSPLGYRLERYLWKAQKPAGSFALAVLRDLSEEDHYLSGPVDLIRFATTVLNGLEAPKPQATQTADEKLATPNGPVLSRRFDLGTRQCVSLGFYAQPQTAEGASGLQAKAAKDEPLTEGSQRLDGVYCATAGRPLTPEQVLAYAAGVKLMQRKD